MRGAEWTFEEFCRVYCHLEKPLAALAAELGRTEGAIDAIRASIEAVQSGQITASFPGPKWEDFVARALGGQCGCSR